MERIENFMVYVGFAFYRIFLGFRYFLIYFRL